MLLELSKSLVQKIPGQPKCVLGLPVAHTTGNSSNEKLLKLVSTFFGGFIGILLFLGVVILYRDLKERSGGTPCREECVNSFWDEMLTNTREPNGSNFPRSNETQTGFCRGI